MAEKKEKLIRYTAWRGTRLKCPGCGHRIHTGEEYEILHEGGGASAPRHLVCMDRFLYHRNVETEFPESVRETLSLEGAEDLYVESTADVGYPQE